MIYAYIRGNTEDSISNQFDLLQPYTCCEIFVDKVSGINEKPQLDILKNKVKRGDSIIVSDLTRLGRHNAKLLELLIYLENKGVKVINIDGDKKETHVDELSESLSAWANVNIKEHMSRKIKAGLQRKKEMKTN